MSQVDQKFMKEAVALSIQNVEQGFGGPFGAVVVKDGQIIARGVNQVTANNDPTAHAEVVAIRQACEKLKSFQLTDCEVYTSCEPCPMCLGALFWARPKAVYYANTRHDAAGIGFDDSFIYDQLELPGAGRAIPCVHVADSKAIKAFDLWKLKTQKITY